MKYLQKCKDKVPIIFDTLEGNQKMVAIPRDEDYVYSNIWVTLKTFYTDSEFCSARFVKYRFKNVSLYKLKGVLLNNRLNMIVCIVYRNTTTNKLEAYINQDWLNTNTSFATAINSFAHKNGVEGRKTLMKVSNDVMNETFQFILSLGIKDYDLVEQTRVSGNFIKFMKEKEKEKHEEECSISAC